MRDAINNLIKSTYILKYKLPESDIPKTTITTLNDYCYEPISDNSVAESIYNSIIDYCLNETEIDITKLNENQIYAIENRLRYLSEDSLDTQLKYGFFGETLLNIILEVLFNSSKIIAKGYFYSPVEKSEPKGYDCFHFVESDTGEKEFWFGESKMYKSISLATKSVIDNINKSLSKKYYESNLRVILSRANDLDETNCTPLFLDILYKIKQGPISLFDEFKNNNIKVMYPILLAYDDSSTSYKGKITNSVHKIQNKIDQISLINEIGASIIFILIPMGSVVNIKKDVLKWISQQKSIL
ncbi:MAG: DUF1837 domain-containing protein [Tenericutes bacterium]|nr:DUF1837 domain-containing protein [Mycoplasmatota bacterium]